MRILFSILILFSASLARAQGVSFIYEEVHSENLPDPSLPRMKTEAPEESIRVPTSLPATPMPAQPMPLKVHDENDKSPH
jgi:hypothetical protein